MIKIIKRVLFSIILSVFLVSGLHAQSTYTAAGCTQAQIQTAVDAEQVSPADGDVIAIPSASPCTWTGTANITQTFSNSVTIQGAGAVSSTAGGASTTGTDNTEIIDDTTGGKGIFSITTVSGKSFRITGIAIIQNSSSVVEGGGEIYLAGHSASVRVDHCHIYSYVSGNFGVQVTDNVLGVADHNFFDNLPGIVTNNFSINNGKAWQGASDGYGDQSWVDTDHWGTSQFWYIEDSRFNYGWANDCHNGGRYVYRYSTFINVNGLANHGLHDTARSCRASELYMNTFSGSSGITSGGGALANNGGPTLAWGNTVSYYNSVLNLAIVRQSSDPYAQTYPPNGWGYCGTQQQQSNGLNEDSSWDGNYNTTTGYPCLDAPGRGAGDLRTGTNFPNFVNSVLGGQTWLREALDPIYVWDNTVSNLSTGIIGDTTISGTLLDNRDYYQQFGAYGESGTFNGTKGVGQGLYSAIPSTCTGGTDPKTGGPAPGVGYWATDQNTLYVCNPTNTWTAYYTPYTYPHPLTGSGSPPNPPTNVQAVGH
jgi:hypothetical protein